MRISAFYLSGLHVGSPSFVTIWLLQQILHSGTKREVTAAMIQGTATGHPSNWQPVIPAPRGSVLEPLQEEGKEAASQENYSMLR